MEQKEKDIEFKKLRKSDLGDISFEARRGILDAVSEGFFSAEEALSLEIHQKKLFANWLFQKLLPEKKISFSEIKSLTLKQSKIFEYEGVLGLIRDNLLTPNQAKELTNNQAIKLNFSYDLVLNEVISLKEALKLNFDFCYYTLGNEINDLIIKNFMTIEKAQSIQNPHDIEKIQLANRLILNNHLTVDDVIRLDEETIKNFIDLKNLINEGVLSFTEVLPDGKNNNYLTAQFQITELFKAKISMEKIRNLFKLDCDDIDESSCTREFILEDGEDLPIKPSKKLKNPKEKKLRTIIPNRLVLD